MSFFTGYNFFLYVVASNCINIIFTKSVSYVCDSLGKGGDHVIVCVTFLLKNETKNG